MTPPRATTVAILAMGGEGGGVLADWIVDLAEHAGYFAQTTSVPGVAQRTGATIYYLEIFPAENGRAPVLALMPVPGEVDIVIASELMEAGRAVQRGLVTPDRTTLIASTHRVYSMTERTAMADGRVDSDTLVNTARDAAKIFVSGDFGRIAEDSRSVISASLFGALAATNVLPFTREQCEDAIRRGGVGVDASLSAFAAGYAETVRTETPAPVPVAAPAPRVGPQLRTLADRIDRAFPTTTHSFLFAGITRLADYQDVRYATQYLDRLESIREADAQRGTGDFALLRETARHLALWMSYEDAIRVADLKVRRTRFERVTSEARANTGQLLRINDYLHPRVDELSDIMPAGIGGWLLRTKWARSVVDALTRRGKIVNTTSLGGFLQLYALSTLRPFRRRSLRFRREQEKIGVWLAQIPPLAAENYALALAAAESPRLLKGYGDTHARGSKNFDAVMATIPALRGRADPAAGLRTLQSAALADDTGEKLGAALQEMAKAQ